MFCWVCKLGERGMLRHAPCNELPGMFESHLARIAWIVVQLNESLQRKMTYEMQVIFLWQSIVYEVRTIYSETTIASPS